MAKAAAPSAIESRPKAGEGSRRVHLDQATVATLQTPTRDQGSWLYLDDEIPGFCCQVTYQGTRTFRLRYRKLVAGERKPRWFSVRIGKWQPGTAGKAMPDKQKVGISAAKAREKAAELRRQLDQGANPALELRAREAELARAEAGTLTVRQAFHKYLAAVRSRRSPMKESSIEKLEDAFEVHILPLLGERQIGGLAQRDVRELAETTAKGRKRQGRKIGGPIAANRVVAHLSAFLTWCTKQEPPLIATNVARLIDRGEVLEKEHARERYLTREEWDALMRDLDERPYIATRGSRFAATKTVRLDKPQLRTLVSCEAIRISLLTGARKGEVYRMRWSDVDLDARWWIKPRTTTKGAKVHEVALPKVAVEALQRVRAAHADPVWVFPGKERMEKLARGEKPKANEGSHVKDVHELWGKIRESLGIPDVRQHDLRHTAASVLISNGASLYDVGAQLGHQQAQTTMRYAHLLKESKHKLASVMDAFASASSTGEGEESR